MILGLFLSRSWPSPRTEGALKSEKSARLGRVCLYFERREPDKVHKHLSSLALPCYLPALPHLLCWSTTHNRDGTGSVSPFTERLSPSSWPWSDRSFSSRGLYAGSLGSCSHPCAVPSAKHPGGSIILWVLYRELLPHPSLLPRKGHGVRS